MPAYYNENDKFAAAWLRNLIAEGLIANGEVDERSIEEVRGTDLAGFNQVHLFAGIGGWSYALRLAAVPDDALVWTGSCPCQAHSSAARGRYAAPDLWAQMFRLVAARRPPILFGEQVAKATWLDRVCDDLEGLGYAVGAAVLPACSLDFDHARPRLFFVGDANGHGESGVRLDGEVAGLPWRDREPRGVAQANGVPCRVGRLRAYGNAIVPQVAATFIRAALDATEHQGGRSNR